MKGQTLVELLLVIGLSAIILPAILTGLVASRSGKVQQNLRLEAVTLLKEAQEAVRNAREKDWNTFAVNGTFHPQIAVDNSWSLAANAETINSFTRSVVISDVNRDLSGAIVLTGGTLDPSTKKVVTTISWSSPTLSSVTSTAYIARLDNITYTETLKAEFDAGTKTGVAVTNTSGGEITLGGGGQGNWCEPAIPSGSLVLDLPKNGVANALTAIEGRAFAGTGENASGVSFTNVTIGNNPPNPSIAGTFDGYKTNDVFGETNYAYIATDTNDKEIVILDISGNPITEVGNFNASGSTDANSVVVAGNVGYMTQGSTFRSFDLSSKSGSRPQLGSITLTGRGSSIYIVGSYAYVALATSSREMQIVDISNPSSLSLLGYAEVDPLHVNPEDVATDVFVNSTGTRTYLTIRAASDLREFFIIDTSTKTGSVPIVGSYEANGMSPKGVTVVTGNKAIIVGDGGEEYQVIDITNESSPSRCGGLDINTDINGIASVLESDGDAYSYTITEDANEEFQILAGGPGGQYASDGTFESQTIPIPMPVNETSFNRFEVNVNRPSQTDIQFQVAVAQAVLESCSGASFTFVGPDGTNSTFFTTSVTSGTENFDYPIPTAINPGQCFRYKIFLSTTESTQTPIFYDITINYAP